MIKIILTLLETFSLFTWFRHPYIYIEKILKKPNTKHKKIWHVCGTCTSMCYLGTCVWNSLTAGVCVECDKSMICILCVNRARWDTYIMHLLRERSKWCTLHCIPWHSSCVINWYINQTVLVLAQGSVLIQRERKEGNILPVTKTILLQWVISCLYF